MIPALNGFILIVSVLEKEKSQEKTINGSALIISLLRYIYYEPRVENLMPVERRKITRKPSKKKKKDVYKTTTCKYLNANYTAHHKF